MDISQIIFKVKTGLLALIFLLISFAQLLSQNNNCRSSLKELDKVLREKEMYENQKKGV